MLAAVPLNVLKANDELDENGEPKGTAVGFVVRDGVNPNAYYQYLQGTSMAAPHAAGVAALIVSEYGDSGRDARTFGLDPAAVQAVLQGTATERDCPEPGHRRLQRHRRLPVHLRGRPEVQRLLRPRHRRRPVGGQRRLAAAPAPPRAPSALRAAPSRVTRPYPSPAGGGGVDPGTSTPGGTVYSLVSASVLALDLARHPCGAAVADTVDRVLTLTPDDVRALAVAGPAPDDVRQRALAACAAAPRMSTLMRGVSGVVAEGLPDADGSRVLLDVLTSTLLGGLEDLLSLLLREQPLADPALPREGVQAALDAVVVAWAGRAEGVELSDLAALRAPWSAALAPVPPALPDAPYAPALRTLLDDVARSGPEAWARVVAAHGQRTEPGSRWSEAMHEASRAAWESGRLVAVARAQLAAARALRLSGVSTGADASAAGMAVTAAVQAVCVQGLVSPQCEQVLRRAWDARRDTGQGAPRA